MDLVGMGSFQSLKHMAKLFSMDNADCSGMTLTINVQEERGHEAREDVGNFQTLERQLKLSYNLNSTKQHKVEEDKVTTGGCNDLSQENCAEANSEQTKKWQQLMMQDIEEYCLEGVDLLKSMELADDEIDMEDVDEGLED
jgi:hypothetical protein